MDSFIEELSQPKPSPGGGAACAHGALLALGLVEKIARLELQRLSSGIRSVPARSLSDVQDLKAIFLSLRQEDSRAYLALAETKASAADNSLLAEALEQAIECPVLMMKNGIRVLGLICRIGALCKRHLVSDLQVACECGLAVVRGASRIGVANILIMKDPVLRSNKLLEVAEILEDAQAAYQKSAELLDSRLLGK
jgi:formiminotetrahydrofolate cyclodeaminase